MDINFIIGAELPQLSQGRNAYAEWLEVSVEAGNSIEIEADAGYLIIAGQLADGVSVNSIAGTAGIGNGLQVHRHTGKVIVNNRNRADKLVSFVKVSFRQ